jgi:hypothetical protein
MTHSGHSGAGLAAPPPVAARTSPAARLRAALVALWKLLEAMAA